MPQEKTLKLLMGLLLGLLLLTSCLPARAWTRVTDLQREPSDVHQDANQLEEDVFRLDGRVSRDLGGTAQGQPSVEGNTMSTAAGEVDPTTAGYLNKLVEATTSDNDNQVANVAFVKTHKTASTTIAAILYRYAARHHLKLSYFRSTSVINLSSAAFEMKESGQRVDIMHYHISKRGQYNGTWKEAVTYYRDIMRNPDDINFVTVLRDPRSHLLSYYYYFLQPQHQQSIEEFLFSPHRNDTDHRLIFNPLSAEFGVRTTEEMSTFISSALPDFKLVLLADRLDEGLLTLGRMLHWQLIDLTYCVLNETKKGIQRWDGRTFVTRPHFDSLPERVQNKIDDLTKLDRVLYEAGKNEFEKRLAPYASSVQEDISRFQELQAVINKYLNGNSSSPARPMYLSMGVYKKRPANYPF